MVSIAAQVFVCQPPFKAPTGKLLGTVHFQRLLREQPSTELRDCVAEDPVVGPEAPDTDVAEVLASYDMLAVAVCDPTGQPARRGDGGRCARPPARRRLAPAPTGGDAPDEDRVTPW